MEAYLRLGLLVIAASIIFLILFEAWYRKRQMDIKNDERPGQRILDPDEILGLRPIEPVFNPQASSEVMDQQDQALPRLQKGEDRSTAFLMGASKSATKILAPSLYNKEDKAEKFDENVEINPQEKQTELRIEPSIQPEAPLTPTRSEVPPSAKDYLILSVVAKPETPFASYELLQAIAATGMRFGDMNIFHYQKLESGGLVTLFSLASATEPGEFNLDNMGHFTCTGLTLFMNLRKVPNPKEAYELMLKTAEQLVDDLEGELRAGPKDPWTPQMKEQYQQRVLQYQYAKSY